MRDILEIGEAIRVARKEARLTQSDLADLSGIGVRTIRAIESGTGNPSIGAVIAAANTVGLHLKAL